MTTDRVQPVPVSPSEAAARSRSNLIFAGLIIGASALAALAVFLPQGSLIPAEEVLASPSRLALINAVAILVLYGGLGFLGLSLARRLGWADVWVSGDTGRERWGVPAALGVAVGGAFIGIDLVAASLHPLGPLPHPPFPTSVVASAVAAVGEEVFFRLFLIPVGVWLVSSLLLGGRFRELTFWAVAVASALAFAAGHLPSVTLLYDVPFVELPVTLLSEIVLLNGVLSLVAAHQLRAHGLLAAAGVHWWADVVWHVLWGLA